MSEYELNEKLDEALSVTRSLAKELGTCTGLLQDAVQALTKVRELDMDEAMKYELDRVLGRVQAHAKGA